MKWKRNDFEGIQGEGALNFGTFVHKAESPRGYDAGVVIRDWKSPLLSAGWICVRSSKIQLLRFL